MNPDPYALILEWTLTQYHRIVDGVLPTITEDSRDPVWREAARTWAAGADQALMKLNDRLGLK